MKYKISLVNTLFLAALLFLGYHTYDVNRRVIELRKTFHHKMKKYRSIVRKNQFAFNKVFHNNYQLPKELKDIPYFTEGAVPEVKEIKIRNAFAPYNGSLIESDNGFFLFFRYDHFHQLFCNKIHTHIGCVELDNKLNQTEKEFIRVDTNSDYSEDPRVIKVGGEYYLIYNDIFEGKEKKRGMHLANLDIQTKKIKTIIPMDLKFSGIEKNWVPFVFNDANKQTKLCFEYEVSHPRQIITMDNLENPTYVEITQQKELLDNMPWNKRWGKPLGGTPARLIDGEYLAFFHSKFEDRNGVYWYVMGAYTFEPNPPFKISRVSPHPILFETIYNSEHRNTAEPIKCVIFPCGYAVKQKNNGQVLIHLACGENDSTIKVVTFDKDALLETLIPVNGD